VDLHTSVCVSSIRNLPNELLTLHLFCKACEDIDTACEGSLDGDITLQNAVYDEFPDRQRVEQNLLRKVDLRMSILVLIYILNYVSRVSTY
jgi:hypothetical protein